MKQQTESQWKQLMKSANVSEFKAECLLSNASNRDSCTCWIVYSIVFARTLVWQDAGSLFIREIAENNFIHCSSPKTVSHKKLQTAHKKLIKK